MRALSLAAVASIVVIAVPISPAQAADEGLTFVSGGSKFHDGFDRHDRRRHRDRGGDIFLGDWEYTGNQVWRSDSYNDWWHDRPDRAYPRWMANNKDCQRLWWGGGTWRC